MNKQGILYTFLYAAVMVILVAALLAFLAESLKPLQNKNVEIAKKIDMLRSINIDSNAENAETKYVEHIVNTYVLNAKGDKVDGVDAFSLDLSKEIKKADSDRLYPIFECKTDNGLKYIIPLRGAGLWGPIWGYISLNDDKNTVFGATFDHQGETPGLGAEINTPAFQSHFKGKTIFDSNGQFVSIKVEKAGQGGKHPNSEVDAISGGTITSKGLESMLFDNMKGYQEFFKLKSNNDE